MGIRQAGDPLPKFWVVYPDGSITNWFYARNLAPTGLVAVAGDEQVALDWLTPAPTCGRMAGFSGCGTTTQPTPAGFRGSRHLRGTWPRTGRPC